MKIQLSQINPVCGDILSNLKHIKDHISCAMSIGADAVVFPDRALIGDQPHTSSDIQRLNSSNDAAIRDLIRFVTRNGKRITVLFGALGPQSEERHIYKVESTGDYSNFPVTACGLERRYDLDELLRLEDCEIYFDAQPWRTGLIDDVLELLSKKTGRQRKLLWVNRLGLGDNGVYGGHSIYISGEKHILARRFQQDTVLIDTNLRLEDNRKRSNSIAGKVIPEEWTDTFYLFSAICFGIIDFVRRFKTSRIFIPVRNRIDDLLTFVLARAALGMFNCKIILLSKENKKAIEALCRLIGIKCFDPNYDKFRLLSEEMCVVRDLPKIDRQRTSEMIDNQTTEMLCRIFSRDENRRLIVSGRNGIPGDLDILGSLTSIQIKSLLDFVNSGYIRSIITGCSPPPDGPIIDLEIWPDVSASVSVDRSVFCQMKINL